MSDLVIIKSNEEFPTSPVVESNVSVHVCELSFDRAICDAIQHLIAIFKQGDEIEISVEIRLFLANEIFPKAYVKYSECKSESKRNMMKTIEFIRNRLLRITYRSNDGKECLRKIPDLERIWIRELLQDIVKHYCCEY